MSGILITHSGSFHADDLFSYVILKRLFPDHALLRTRDEAVFRNSTRDDIIFDVGMQYSPEYRRYDHHMRDAPRRENGFPYSACGLVWKFHGRDYLRSTFNEPVSEETIDRLWLKVDRSFIFYLDCADNGVDPSAEMSSRLPTSISMLIENLAPVSDDVAADFDEAFIRAADLCETLLIRKIEHQKAYERGREVVLEALKTSADPRILELPISIDWTGHIFEMGNEDVLFAVYPSQGAWNCSAAKTRPGSWDNRFDLPSEWGGLRNEALAAVSGVADAVFCHDKLFICVAGSREGIMEMVQKALEHKPGPNP